MIVKNKGKEALIFFHHPAHSANVISLGFNP